MEYKKNFLTNVIIRIDYTSIQNFSVDKLKEFQNLIKTDFPIVEEANSPLLELKVDEKQKIDTKTSEILKWNFLSKDRKRIFSVENNNLTLEFLKYTSYKDFSEKQKMLLDSFKAIFGDVTSTRLGLRYVNQIDLEDTSLELSEYIKPELLEVLKFRNLKNNLSRYIAYMEIREEDYNLRFQFGIPNSLYPERIIKKEFVLDYDCFIFDSLTLEEIPTRLKRFNDIVTGLFEESIMNKLKNLLEPAEDKDEVK